MNTEDSPQTGQSHRPTDGPTSPPQVVIQQKASMFGRFGKLLVALLILAVMCILGLTATYQSYFNPATGPQERFHSLSPQATKKIAIISATGAILEGDGFIKQQIDRVEKDDDVVAVVLRINSPGGTVTGSDFIYHHLRELIEERELPLVVSMGSICASGGYYIAMAVGHEPDTIFAEPTTWTGSIGVIIPHYDLSGLLERWNIEENSITSGPFKQMGSPTQPMTEEERAIFQELVDSSFVEFKKTIRSGRAEFSEDPAALDKIATGRIFTATQAMSNGLVDKIGFVEAAIERAAELAGEETENLRCVKFEQPKGLLDVMVAANAELPPLRPLEMTSLVNLLTPRAYYLFTWLPPALTNTPPK